MAQERTSTVIDGVHKNKTPPFLVSEQKEKGDDLSADGFTKRVI